MDFLQRGGLGRWEGLGVGDVKVENLRTFKSLVADVRHDPEQLRCWFSGILNMSEVLRFELEAIASKGKGKQDALYSVLGDMIALEAICSVKLSALGKL